MTRAMTVAMILAAGVAFGAWPLITRGSKLHYLPAGLALQIGTMATFIIFMCLTQTSADLKSAFNLENDGRLVWIALLAGLVNGLGQLAMQKLVASHTVEISVFATATLAVMAVVYMIGGYLIYHEPITPRKIAGLCTAIITLQLLMGR